MGRRPSLLAVTSEVPWPLDSGGHLRTYHLLRSLAADFHVRLVTQTAPGHEPYVDRLSRDGIEVRPARPAGWPIRTVRVLSAAVRGLPYVLYRKHHSRAMHAVVRAEIDAQPPDLLYLDHLDSFQYARHGRGTPTIVDLHNVYSLLVRREAAERGRSWLARRYLAREALLLERAEARAVAEVDAVFSVSEQEVIHFSGIAASQVHLVPNGVDCSRYESLPTGRRVLPPRILFVGALSWPANVHAVRFLAHDVLPVVHRRVPDAVLTIVGRNPGPEVLRLASQNQHISVLGNVPDVVPYLQDASVFAVPLESGGGTRLKILEAFAAGLPVVSTPVGCEGIAAIHNRDLLVARSADFAEALCATLEQPDIGAALAASARRLVREHYDWRAIGRTARDIVASISASRAIVGVTKSTVEFPARARA